MEAVEGVRETEGGGAGVSCWWLGGGLIDCIE
jgi:hypothetical protein